MALPSTGQLTMNMITAEAGVTNLEANLDNYYLRKLARKLSGQIKYSDFYGKFRYSFPNGNFSEGTLPVPQPSEFSIPGWTVYNKRVRLSGLDSIRGRPTPNDPTTTEYGAVGDATTGEDVAYSAELTSDLPSSPTAGSRSMRLVNNGRSVSHAIIHGPYLSTADTVPLEAGDKVSFWWKAEGGSDAFDIFSYLLNSSNGSTILLLNATGNSSSAVTPWTKVQFTVTSAQAGNYYFIFISGAHDFTGGTALGASLYVTMVDVEKP